jgi:Cytochrome c7 and related cytochrome c
VILFVLWTAGSILAASNVGAERCKLCHRAIYESWKATPHAKEAPSAFEGRCLSCHATGNEKLPAVQCEACHGPGSEYSLPEVMIDPEKAEMAGLVRPTLVTCERCHENDEPRHKGTLVMPGRNEWSRFLHAMKDP